MRPEETTGGHGGAPRRKKKHSDEHDAEHPMVHDESNWLVSYADMMTLLFGFFVLMYSFSKIDTEKFEVVRKDMARAFGGKIVEEPAGLPQGMKPLEKDLTEGLQAALGQNGDFNTEIENGNLILTLRSDVLFASGSAVAGDKAVQVVHKIFEVMKNQPVQMIEVEGHTDADPIATAQYPSNWELSTARASSLVRVFSQLKVPAQKLKATGFADSRPVPRTPEQPPVTDWRRRDRRVVINLKMDPTQKGIKEKLLASGLAVEDTTAVKAAQEDPKNLSAQEKLEEVQRKLQEASQRWAEAQAQEKKVKELEALNRKTAELEKKLNDMQKKTQESLEKSRQQMKTLPAE